MKKTILILLVICLVSFTAERTFTIRFTESQINKHWQKLDIIKQLIDKSDLPHQTVSFVIKSTDSLQMDILPQVQAQLADTLKKKP